MANLPPTGLSRTDSKAMVQPWRMDWIAILLFGLGLLRFFEFQSFGTVFGTDLGILVCLPFALARAGRLRDKKETLVVLGLLLLWFLSAVVTDLIRATAAEDLIRGWSKVGLFGATLFVIIVLSEYRMYRLTAYMCGLAVAIILGVLLHPTAYQAGQPWKFGLGLNVGILACALAPWLVGRGAVSKLIRLLPITVVAAICLVTGARSMFGTIGLAIAATIAADFFGAHLRRLRATLPVWAVFVVLGGVTAYGIVGLYSVLAENGALGLEAQSKYEAQAATGNLLLAGRGEVMVSTRAIATSPILGHGSWAKEIEYSIMLVSLARDRGVNAVFDRRTGEGIPSHSYFFQTWVEHGILGAIFWAATFVLAMQSILTVIRMQPSFAPLFFLAVFSLLWAIMFTPFGAENRFVAAAQIAMVLWALAEGRRRGLVPPRRPQGAPQFGRPAVTR
jgi:O-antigen ligase